MTTCIDPIPAEMSTPEIQHCAWCLAEEQFFVNMSAEHSLKTYKDKNYGLWSFPEGMPVIGQIKGRDEWTFGTTVNGFSSEYALSEVRE
jgi:hypothetical protein